MNTIDLHMHSIYSDDGEYTPTELMKMCKDAGLQIVAIADHNSTKAIPEARNAAEKLKLTYIPAIELDCTIHGVDLHVLGYGIDENNQALLDNAEYVKKQAQNVGKEQIEKVKALGFYIDEDACYALSHEGVITGEIIAEVALQDERNHPLMKEYLPGGSRSDNPFVNFYWDYCAQSKPAYVPIHYISLKEAVDMIHAAGGIAVLAHPGNNTKENLSLIDAIFAYDVKGMEVYSSYHSPEQIAFYKDYAEQHYLMITMGSDFHGKTKPSIALGGSHCPDTSLYENAILSLIK
ncbi:MULTISPECIES: PHP domain-containing protein [Erysipelotrichaceae]|jgi:3',5'-nucleoside bisphosphate phosphatase|uniref:PHP domain-containing protein n=1 Tax=Amedibacillus hominis TaxID=2897776 RepID=A0ABS9RAT9_9FIRM|nr:MULTISPECIES: PHP domain-containing protein [Erysipelotrichaceae]MCH4286789.1 PHP domain-containing protein [Amedibacillus hominis]RGB66055.1 PHP domain-containing protein [Absiella sp. AM09-45]RGB75060.1 PHP domain-containing protein [Absiella sp. AM09-50]RGC19535.1 PHP domain-containing protein [Absiella sp. AM54-8XD]RHU08030.1 PHP domain-containing protein [Absiella sp. AM27-20]